MIEDLIKQNTEDNNEETIIRVVKKIVEKLKTDSWVQVTRTEITEAQARTIADMFRAKGYHHEIRINSNEHGAVFFYALNISKNPIDSKSARFSHGEYVA